jgi:hypothetical protein
MFMNNEHCYETLLFRCCLTGNLVDPVAVSVVTPRSGTTQYGGCATPNYQTHRTETQRRLTIGTNISMDGLGPTLRWNIACPRNHDQKVSELDSTYVRLEKWVKSEVREYIAVLCKEVREKLLF